MSLHRTLITLVVVLGLGVFVLPLASQPQRSADAVSDLGSIRVPDLADRLAALRPERPADYMLLAEEVASEAQDRPTRELARRLYVLAFALDRPGQPGFTGRVAPGAAMALAGLTQRESEQRWLLAVARAAEPASGVGQDRPLPPDAVLEVPSQVAYDLASLLGLARGGDGRRAASLLAKPGVDAALTAYESVLDDRGFLGGGSKVRRAIADWPSCPTCRNRRVVTRNADGGLRAELCPKCKGNPGPTFSTPEVITQLRMESALLKGIHRMWSAQALADGGEPLRDPLPDELPAWYRTDVRATVFRDGAWVAPPPAGP
jgi:hypothetical protein